MGDTVCSPHRLHCSPVLKTILFCLEHWSGFDVKVDYWTTILWIDEVVLPIDVMLLNFSFNSMRVIVGPQLKNGEL